MSTETNELRWSASKVTKKEFDMKNIFAKVAASMLFVALISSLPAAAQELASDTQRKANSVRAIARKSTDIMLNCGGSKTLGGVLAGLNPDKAHTIRISGACNENVDIVAFQHLILLAENGASISDASGGTLPVLNVLHTTLFEMHGFTINGGGSGVDCAYNSICSFADNTFQDSVGAGVFVLQSRADFFSDVMQNNGSQGLLVQEGSTVSIFEVSLLNNVTGASAGFGSTLIAIDSTMQGNGNNGLRASFNSTLRLSGNTVSGNGGDGVLAFSASVASFFFGNIVSNNGEAGVRITDLSYAGFLGEDVTGNLGGTDVLCEPQFPATRGALTNISGGTTNCVEP